MPSLLIGGEARRLCALQRKAARRRRARSRGGPQSHREREAYRQVASLRARQTRRRTDWLHKTTTQVASSYGTVVVEDLNIAGMTRSGRGTAASPGKNVKAKAGLNRAVIGMAWGRAQWMLAYKAASRGGRLIKTAAPYSSQTCAECGHVSAENRRSRDRFHCLACGYAAAADTNAARVRRGYCWVVDLPPLAAPPRGTGWLDAEPSPVGELGCVNPGQEPLMRHLSRWDAKMWGPIELPPEPRKGT